MYTVFRIYESPRWQSAIGKLAEVFQKMYPDLFDDIDPSGDRFSCSICDGADGKEHEKAIENALAKVEAFAQRVAPMGFDCVVDIAVYTSDIPRGGFYREVQFSPRLMDKMIRTPATLIVTVYDDSKPGEQQDRGGPQVLDHGARRIS